VATQPINIPKSAAGLSTLAQNIGESPEVADAYVALLGALRLSRSLATGNSILVTSAEPGEGKTTIAACLAVTASLAGQTVLLIDGDSRRSSLASAIGISESVGLIELLLGRIQVDEAVHPVPALVDSPRAGLISVMAGGRQSAALLPAVDWVRTRSEFRSICQTFDIVLLDSPPILAANDALLLASVVDAILLVVGAGSANLDAVRHAKEQLDLVGTPVIGTVLNRFEPKAHGRWHRPYHSYNGSSR